VQLIIGKYILPFFGGAAAVWILCLLFFQVLLLVGYTYAHVVSRLPRLPSQGKTHAGVLLGCLVVFVTFWARWETPLTPGLEWMPRPDTNPVWKIFELLAITVALPFLILSTTGPLLQSWHSRCYPDKTPYSLYALSNAGSLLGVPGRMDAHDTPSSFSMVHLLRVLRPIVRGDRLATSKKL
jgi:hypothetical protein